MQYKISMVNATSHCTNRSASHSGTFAVVDANTSFNFYTQTT